MDMEEQPGSISSMTKIRESLLKLIDETSEWSPELQMRIEQAHVLGVLIEGLKDLD